MTPQLTHQFRDKWRCLGAGKCSNMFHRSFFELEYDKLVKRVSDVHMGWHFGGMERSGFSVVSETT